MFTGKKCFVHNMGKLCNFSEVFIGQKMVNLITVMVSIEIVRG